MPGPANPAVKKSPKQAKAAPKAKSGAAAKAKGRPKKAAAAKAQPAAAAGSSSSSSGAVVPKAPAMARAPMVKAPKTVEQVLSAKTVKLQQVDEALKLLGLEQPGATSLCVRAGIGRGNLPKITNETDLDDEAFFKSQCYMCAEVLSCSLRQLLAQDDNPGTDYECGAEGAALQCEKCEQGT